MVKFSCGCVGLPTKDPQHTIIFKICDADFHSSGNICATHRDMTNKDYEYMSERDAKCIIEEMGSLIGDGYKFREIRGLLNG